MGSSTVPGPNKGNLAATLGVLTGGLLSSSCCLLQLALNFTPVGCAGFSVLTPYRHYFRAVTGSLVAYLLFVQGLNRRTLTTVLLSAGLMASQDVLSLYNKGQLRSGVQQLLQHVRVRPPGAAERQQAQQRQTLAASRTKLQVKGMRCEGCAARLRGNLASLEGVDGCTVAFSEGLVEVWSNRSQPVAVQALVQAVQETDRSYEVGVLSRDCFDAQGRQRPCPCAPAAAASGSEEL